MPTTRRTFLTSIAAAGGAIGLAGLPRLARGGTPLPATGRPAAPPGRAPTALDILILGGTGFTGPEQVEYALARGHRVTLFNRNKTRPDFFKGSVPRNSSATSMAIRARSRGSKFDVVHRQPDDVPGVGAQRGEVPRRQRQALHLHLDAPIYPRQQPSRADENRPADADAGGARSLHRRAGGRAQYYGALKTRSREGSRERCIRASTRSSARA